MYRLNSGPTPPHRAYLLFSPPCIYKKNQYIIWIVVVLNIFISYRKNFREKGSILKSLRILIIKYKCTVVDAFKYFFKVIKQCTCKPNNYFEVVSANLLYLPGWTTYILYINVYSTFKSFNI